MTENSGTLDDLLGQNIFTELESKLLNYANVALTKEQADVNLACINKAIAELETLIYGTPAPSTTATTTTVTTKMTTTKTKETTTKMTTTKTTETTTDNQKDSWMKVLDTLN